MNGANAHLELNSSPIASGTVISRRSCSYASGLGADGLLQEVERAGGQSLAVGRGLGHGHPVVPVDAQRWPGADRLAHLDGPLGRQRDGIPWVESSCFAGMDRAAGGEAEHVPALGHEALGVFHELRSGRRAGREQGHERAAGRPAVQTVRPRPCRRCRGARCRWRSGLPAAPGHPRSTASGRGACHSLPRAIGSSPTSSDRK